MFNFIIKIPVYLFHHCYNLFQNMFPILVDFLFVHRDQIITVRLMLQTCPSPLYSSMKTFLKLLSTVFGNSAF